MHNQVSVDIAPRSNYVQYSGFTYLASCEREAALEGIAGGEHVQ